VPYMADQQEGTLAERKSVGLALLLAYFFGPFGMLYSTVTGAIIMGGVMGAIMIYYMYTHVFFLDVAWLTCMIWACVAASQSGEKSVSTQDVGDSPLAPPAR